METNYSLSTENSINMTCGGVFKPLIKFAIPMFFSYIIEQLYTTVDSIIVGRFVGAGGLAAIGITSQIIMLTVSLSVGLISGISTIVSEYYGSGNYGGIKNTVAISVWVIIGTYIIKVIIGLFAPQVLVLTNAPEDVLAEGVTYLRYIFYGGFFTFAYSMLIFLLRACGDSVKPLSFMVVSSVTNVALDLYFVGNLKMGVGGAAIATVISQSITAVLCIVYIRRNMKILCVGYGDFKGITVDLVRYVFKLSVPSAIQSGSVTACAIIVQSVINSYGTYVVAGYVAAQKIENLVYMFFLSLTATLATFVSQNRGAGKFKRIRRGAHIIELISVAIAGTLGIICFFFGPELIGIFVKGNETKVIQEGFAYMRITCGFYFIGALWQSFSGVLRGMADAKAPLIIGIIQIVSSLMGIFILTPAIGINGIWWSVSVSWTLCAMIAYVRMKFVLKDRTFM